jgi:hypothetical protein
MEHLFNFEGLLFNPKLKIEIFMIQSLFANNHISYKIQLAMINMPLTLNWHLTKLVLSDRRELQLYNFQIVGILPH